jgi:hypothetical protein
VWTLPTLPGSMKCECVRQQQQPSFAQQQMSVVCALPAVHATLHSTLSAAQDRTAAAVWVLRSYCLTTELVVCVSMSQLDLVAVVQRCLLPQW